MIKVYPVREETQGKDKGKIIVTIRLIYMESLSVNKTSKWLLKKMNNMSHSNNSKNMGLKKNQEEIKSKRRKKMIKVTSNNQ